MDATETQKLAVAAELSSDSCGKLFLISRRPEVGCQLPGDSRGGKQPDMGVGGLAKKSHFSARSPNNRNIHFGASAYSLTRQFITSNICQAMQNY